VFQEERDWKIDGKQDWMEMGAKMRLEKKKSGNANSEAIFSVCTWV
jgi:hypothetical protein